MNVADEQTPENSDIILDEMLNIFRLVDRMKAEDKGALIHCNAGMSRSSTVVIALIMREKRCSFEGAFKYVNNIRPIVRPLFFNLLCEIERPAQRGELDQWLEQRLERKQQEQPRPIVRMRDAARAEAAATGADADTAGPATAEAASQQVQQTPRSISPMRDQ